MIEKLIEEILRAEADADGIILQAREHAAHEIRKARQAAEEITARARVEADNIIAAALAEAQAADIVETPEPLPDYARNVETAVELVLKQA